jgi:hypothetical protein
MTEEDARAAFRSEFWKSWSKREIATLQLWEDRLCVPFPVFHEALEAALGRPVFIYELAANRDGLKRELLGLLVPQ